MKKSSNIRIVGVRHEAEEYALRTPIKFGGRVMSSLTVFGVEVDVETCDGRRGTGCGSMPLGNAWAWPGGYLDAKATLSAMRTFGELAAKSTAGYQGQGHPLEISQDLHHDFESIAQQAALSAGLTEPMPKLAQLNAASPIDAAIHDAFGKALGQNSYDLLGHDFVSRDLGNYLTAEFAGEYLDRYTLRRIKPRMPLYHLVGALDPLTKAEINVRVDDGLPESLDQWIQYDELSHLKIKLSGDDLKWDLQRVLSVHRVAMETQVKPRNSDLHYSLDFNERCPNVEYLLDFLRQLQEISPKAFDRLQYIEQPTNRDLRANPSNQMHKAARIKPIVIDESLVDFETFLLAREMGYSGVALKTCKGHSEALLMSAAAQKYGMFLCVQDLTCPGASFLHSVTLAARIPNVAAVEGNARQFCPAGNRALQSRFPTVFKPQDGFIQSGLLDQPGLGF